MSRALLWDAARPLLIDLYSGAGGAAMGYWRAGWNVLGVDNRPQPRYPFAFVQADALQFLAGLVAQGARLERIGALHASPPCPGRSTATPEHARGKQSPPDRAHAAAARGGRQTLCHRECARR